MHFSNLKPQLKHLWPLLIVFVCLVPLLLPLARPGFFTSDDGGWMVIRLSAFHETLKTGQFPVRFLERLNHDYGYPVLNFLYPLPFYLGEIIHLVGVSFINSVKLLFAASFLLGGVFMYLWAKRFGTFSGIVAACIYSYFPYRITDVYQRGSLGESVAFIFLPLIFLFLDKKKIVLSSIFVAALITSHNSLAFMFLPLILAYAFLIAKISILELLKLLFLALGLSAFFWLPALYDLQFAKALITQVSNYQDYFAFNWLVIGEVALVGLLSGILLKKQAVFWLVAIALTLFLTLQISLPLWQLLPLPKLVQFPWRFLAIPALGLGILGAMLAAKHKFIGLALITLFIVLGLWSLKVDHIIVADAYYSTNDDTTTVKNEYMPIWVKVNPTSRPLARYEVKGKKLQINTVYFPGITVLVDGKPVAIDYTTNGLLLIAKPANLNSIRVVYMEPPIHKLANLLTLLTFFGLLFLLLKPKFHRDH